MSQSDNSLFFILIRSLFLITTFGFGVCLVHFFYQSVSKIKVVYNFFGKVVTSEKLIQLGIFFHYSLSLI
jgi:hypothetical protein